MNPITRLPETQTTPPAIDPSSALTLVSLQIDRGEFEDAEALLGQILAVDPGREEAFYLSGLLQERAGRLEAAAESFRFALTRRDDLAVLHCGLGRVLLASRSPEEAANCFRRALALDPGSSQTRSHLAAALLDLGRFEEASVLARFALSIDPDSPAALGNLGQALNKLGRHEEAAASFRSALTMPTAGTMAVSLRLRLANSLGRQERFDEALACLHEFSDGETVTAEVQHEIGRILNLAGRFQEGIAWLRRALALAPVAEIHYDLCMALLRNGEFREGWAEYEWRWRALGRDLGSLAGFRGLTEPLWDGSPFPGRTLLLHAEQGLGDTIQFARYIPLIAARGGTVILEVQPELKRLMRSLPGVLHLVAAGEPLPKFDLQCPLLSAPLAFGTTLETVPPPAPYRLPPGRARAAGALRVGIVWAGSRCHPNDHNRSLPLDLLIPIFGNLEIDFYSFQVGPAAAEIERLGLAGRVRNLAPLLSDFTDTADALTDMDLVISVDTAVAHLAGSLRVETWVLIPFVPDWRWLLDREDSPWYPGMRLFRQTRRGEWLDVIDRVRRELDKRATAIPAEVPAPGGSVRRSDDGLRPAPSCLVLEEKERARQAADFIPSGASVLDLECGCMAMERYLPPGCTYLPSDCTQRDERTLVCNLDKQSIPHVAGATHITALGVLDHISDWRGFLKQLRAFNLPAVISYTSPDFAPPGRIAPDRPDLRTLCEGIQDANLRIQASMRCGSDEVMIRLTPEPRPVLKLKRVAILSYNNVGNFGDRLGYHLINSLLPGESELHYLHFKPWDVPEVQQFDLAIVGMGASVFEGVLNDQLLAFLDRVPVSIGIFGTQYRPAIDRKKMGGLLDRLSIWFARHEEDALWFGRGRSNVEHLGDWLISAFPMAQWSRDETLQIGPEIWGDLPLDRTIQKIQQHRAVHSSRVHPLLCALTSAERVAYREQREARYSGDSGKFRSMFLDIFGRTYAEDQFFEFNRDAVAGYRLKVLARMAGMPGRIAKLLGEEENSQTSTEFRGIAESLS
jgi:tetratricopeptide (TPR) repeat protein